MSFNLLDRLYCEIQNLFTSKQEILNFEFCQIRLELNPVGSFHAFKASFFRKHGKFWSLFRNICKITMQHPVFEAMVPLPRSMASSLLALPRSCHDLAMILARIPWPCKIVQRLTMINHDLGKGSMVPLAKLLEN